MDDLVRNKCWKKVYQLPNEGNGCDYIHRIEKPPEERAMIVIKDLQKQLTRKLHRCEYKISQLMESFNIHKRSDSEDEIQNEDEDEDKDDNDENENEYEYSDEDEDEHDF